MAKKRRSRRHRKKRRASVAAPPPEPLRQERRAEREVEAVAWAEEYPHVFGDLKRIAILASIMFAILIFLSFVIK